MDTSTLNIYINTHTHTGLGSQGYFSIISLSLYSILQLLFFYVNSTLLYIHFRILLPLVYPFFTYCTADTSAVVPPTCTILPIYAKVIGHLFMIFAYAIFISVVPLRFRFRHPASLSTVHSRVVPSCSGGQDSCSRLI